MTTLVANRWIDQDSGITIEATKVGQGTALQFAVRKDGLILNKQGGWEYEPIPSERTDSFKQRCRWDDFGDAVKALESAPASE
ncbi:hypothetical protein [Reinekea sp. G2M2-21]|uniref:hypothetical protein n=1 Tax=Reinekea sp. G2M2-21 TaxID=2788942 RepID=UPI0018A8B797|nr:hypothetical protein [Reinekea sp. G2M2-21]